jgi:hypothetical protein
MKINAILIVCFTLLASPLLAANGRVFPCGDLAMSSAGALLDVYDADPGVVGGAQAKRDLLAAQSMNAVLLSFGCPKEFVSAFTESDTENLRKWIEELPQILDPRTLTNDDITPYLSAVARDGLGAHGRSSREFVTRGLQERFRQLLKSGSAITPVNVCGTAATLTISRLAILLKDGTGSTPFSVETQLTALFGTCPAEFLRAMANDSILLERWSMLLEPSIYRVVPERKDRTIRLRQALIRFSKQLEVNRGLIGTLAKVREVISRSNVSVID